MPTDLRVNTSLDVDQQRLQRLQHLAATQAVIQAEIAALSSSVPTPSYQQQNRVQKHHRRNSNVSRNMSSNGATMARHLSSVGQLFGSLSSYGSNDK